MVALIIELQSVGVIQLLNVRHALSLNRGVPLLLFGPYMYVPCQEIKISLSQGFNPEASAFVGLNCSKTFPYVKAPERTIHAYTL